MSIFSWMTKTRGGVHAPHRKHTAESETVTLPLPKVVIIPMQQHVGAPCIPTVKVGDTVEVGQLIADSDAPISAPIHSSVSGTVTALKELLLPGGRTTAALVIDSDGEQRVHSSVKPPKVDTFEEFIAAVRASGLVGLGGAGFPMHVKLNPKNLSEIDTLIINAAECEPYITTDYRECMENPSDVISGIETVMGFLDVNRVIIAIERNKPAAIEGLSKMVADISTETCHVTVKPLPARYPQGAEKVLVEACTGRRVPEGGLPTSVNCIVMNVTSVAELSRYLKTGMPLVTKRLTVDGSAVENPMNVRAVIGTPVRELLNFVGLKEAVRKLLFGGPMMGLALMDDELPILKQNNAILACAEEYSIDYEATTCIRCGRCIDACPMNLMPTEISKAYHRGDTEALQQLGTMTCMECGCCTFSCPAHRPIVQTIRMAKDILRTKR